MSHWDIKNSFRKVAKVLKRNTDIQQIIRGKFC